MPCIFIFICNISIFLNFVLDFEFVMQSLILAVLTVNKLSFHIFLTIFPKKRIDLFLILTENDLI
jgi:hypothetical protein